MKRRTSAVLVCVMVLAGLVAVLGGAGTGQAGPRDIDPFTLTAAPNPAQLGKSVTFTISATNSSAQTLTHLNFEGTATLGLFDSYTSSQGTCAVDSGNPAKVNCSVGNLTSGATVTATFKYLTPSVASGATSMSFSGLMRTTEQGGDPGSPSQFFPTPNPVVVALEPPQDDKVIDVADTTGDTFSTAPVTAKNNDTSTGLTVPATGTFVPVTIVEGATDATVCGTGATPVLETSDITALGTFAPPLSVVLDLLAKDAGPFKKIVACHNGAVLPDCPNTGPIPGNGCLDDKIKAKNANGIPVYRLIMLSSVNGKWGGGLG